MFCRKTRGSHQNHGRTRERWQACDTHFHSRTAYFDFLPHGDSRDFTIYAFLHTFSIPILQPAFVSHCYRLSYVWQTPWAESPSKRQMGGNSASLSFLQMTHVTFWSARGMNVGWRIGFRHGRFSRVSQPSPVEPSMEPDWQVRDSPGVWAAVCGTGSLGPECQTYVWFTCSARCATPVMTCCYWSEHQHEHFGFCSSGDTWSFQMKSHTQLFLYMLFAWSSIPGSRQVKLNRQHLRHNVPQNASRLDLKAEIQNLQLNKNSLSLLLFC